MVEVLQILLDLAVSGRGSLSWKDHDVIIYPVEPRAYRGGLCPALEIKAHPLLPDFPVGGRRGVAGGFYLENHIAGAEILSGMAQLPKAGGAQALAPAVGLNGKIVQQSSGRARVKDENGVGGQPLRIIKAQGNLAFGLGESLHAVKGHKLIRREISGQAEGIDGFQLGEGKFFLFHGDNPFGRELLNLMLSQLEGAVKE